MHRLKLSLACWVFPALIFAQAPDSSQPIRVISDASRGSIPVTVVSGVEMIPLRGAASFIGATVRPGEAGAATISGNGKMARVSNGRNFVPVEGRLVLLQSPVQQSGDEWLVPLDFLTKVLPTLSAEAISFREQDRLLVLGSSFPRLSIRTLPDPNFTRVMIESDRAVPMELTERGDAIRVRIETPFLTTDFRDEDVGDDVVERITLAQDDETYLVTVLLGDRFGALRVNTGRNDADPLVLDLVRTRVPTRGASTVQMDLSEVIPEGEEPAEGEPGQPGQEAQEDVDPDQNPNTEEIHLSADEHRASTLPNLGTGPAGPSELRIITLDPGHGGSETGALGQAGSLEKNLVLSVARKFRNKLETGLGVRVILTRDGDSELTLDERAAIANTNRSSLFVSIHADASPRRRARGSSVYFLSYASTGENQPAPAGGDLDFILWDMAQASHLSQSSQLAEILQEELQSITGGETVNRGIKQNTFRVLRGATMPAVLVELGFISNPDEEKLLSSADYQDRLADALYRGVRRYKDLFENQVPPARGSRRSQP